MFKIGWFYWDLLELYSDGGNIKVMEQILKFNNIDYKIDKISIGDNVDLAAYDFLFFGGGTDLNMEILSEDLFARRNELKKALSNKTFILGICGGYQMFGKYYLDHLGNKVKCLDLFEFYTESGSNRLVGNIEVRPVEKIGLSSNIIGFENHGGYTKGIDKGKSLGEVIHGFGNDDSREHEGYLDEYFLGTYLHGPLLPKNPEIAKYIIEKILKDKYGVFQDIKLKFLDAAINAKKEVQF